MACSERLGADQALGQQHGDRLAALEHHGERSADDLETRPGVGPQQMTPIASSTGSTA